jgi:hypothetical protein
VNGKAAPDAALSAILSFSQAREVTFLRIFIRQIRVRAQGARASPPCSFVAQNRWETEPAASAAASFGLCARRSGAPHPFARARRWLA